MKGFTSKSLYMIIFMLGIINLLLTIFTFSMVKDTITDKAFETTDSITNLNSQLITENDNLTYNKQSDIIQKAPSSGLMNYLVENNVYNFDYFVIKYADRYYSSDSNFVVTKGELLKDSDFSLVNISALVDSESVKNYYAVTYRFLFRNSEIYCFKALEDTFKTLNNSYVDHRLIISNSGLIINQLEGISSNKFFQILRNENNDDFVSEYIQAFQEKQESINFIVRFMNEKAHIYAKKLEYSGEETYFLVEVTFQDNILSSFNQLSGLLYAYYAIILSVSVIALLILSLILNRKIKVIDTTKYSYNSAIPIILTISKRGAILRSSKSFENILDYKKINHINDFDIVYYGDGVDKPISYVREQVAFTVMFTSKQQKIVFYRFIPVATGYGYQLVGEYITDEYIKEMKIRSLATQNQDTLLPNNVELEHDLEAFITKTKFEKCSILGICITNLSNIDKTFGYNVGKEFIKKVAPLIHTNYKKFSKMTLYHSSHDTFLLLISGINDYHDINSYIEYTKNHLKQIIKIGNHNLIPQYKMGVYNIDNKDAILTKETVINNVMQALNKAKKNNNYHLVYFDENLNRDVMLESQILQDMRNGFEKEEFALFLQPQYSLKEQKIIGFEALIRWNNPKYKNCSPQHFIELAEKNGLISDIGKFVLKESVKIGSILSRYKVDLSVNISPAEVMQAGFVSEFMNAYKQGDFAYNNIALEITETFLMESFSDVVSKLNILKENGFGVHLDDFGTGYSSLLYLKELPIDMIKIDKEFIKEITEDNYSKAIVKQIISMSKDLSLKVIAEGVEEEAQKELLEKYKCDIIQGYLIGKAVPFNEALELLKKYNHIEIGSDVDA